MRELAKRLARGLATVAALPWIVSFRLCAGVIGRDRAIESSTQSLARLPGVRGQYVRRAFLAHALQRCHHSATICYGTLFSKAGAVIEEHVYIGPGCHLGLVHLERDVLIAAGVHVPSGAATHGTGDLDAPIREQEGRLSLVTIGAGTWVGSAAVVMANVGRHAVIGAGAVVTRPIPDYSFAAGVPARVIKMRQPADVGI